VARIDLWVDDTLALSLYSPDPAGINPLILSYPLVATEAGSYSLVARAYNTRGAMTEAPAVTVFVSEPLAGDGIDAPDDQTILYIVQDSDTLQSIAANTGISVANIQAANGGIQKVNPGQGIAIPHPPLPQPPQPSAIGAIQGGGNAGGASAGGASGAGPSAIAGLAPALIPGGPQGNLPSIDPSQKQLVPNILPDPKTISDISSAPIKAPALNQIIPTGCKVEVNWTDNSDNETGFAIYRRLDPNEPISKIVGRVGPDVETFVDTVPYPASYQYSVEALGPTSQLSQNQADILNIKQVINTARSNFRTADVQPDANCIAAPAAMKHIYFNIDRLFVKDPSIKYAALWYSINNSAPRRVPTDQGSYDPPNGTDFRSTGYIPLPSSIYLNPDQPIIVRIWAAGHNDYTWYGDGIGPINLGMTINSHQVKDIQPRGQYFYLFDFSNDKFYGKYSIAITDAVYGGVYSSTQMPSPFNLNLIENQDQNVRKLEWSWSGDPNLLEGYVIYRSYSCLGQDTDVRAPLVIGKESKSYSLPNIYEPQGCSYQYQVSALGKLGESALSNAVTGETEDTYGIAYVTFKQVKIKGLDTSQSGEFNFQAGSLNRNSTPMWLVNQENIIYPGEKMFLDGKSPNNTITLVLNPKYSMMLAFQVSGLRNGQTQPGSICMESITLDPADWNQPSSTHTLKSKDGKCEAIVEITTVPPAVGASGQKVLPQADLEIHALAFLGDDYYINIQNNGPQDLQAAKITVGNSWGDGICGDQNLYDVHLNGPYNVSFYTVDIKAGNAIWLHLSDLFDKNVNYLRSADSKAVGDCYSVAAISVNPTTTSDNTTPGAYIETDPSNNKLRIPVSKIESMQY
jgi:LysM repeat protein